MYELIPVGQRAFYLESPTKVGLVLTGEGSAVAIDSGSDKDAGKKLLKHLQAQELTLDAVLCTHSHADHIGGCALMQSRTGCRIFAPGIECDFTNHPVLEPACLWGGFPPDALRNKFLLAQESKAEPLTEPPAGLEVIPLPGHSFDMVGFRTDEDVVYLADCLSSRETLEKYGIGYLWDVEAYLATLERVEAMQARVFVPAHAPATEDIAPLCRFNREAVRAAAERIASFCAEPTDFETILQRVFAAYGLTMNAQQYALIGSTVRSYLTYLQRQGAVDFAFEDNRMLWRRVI